MYRNLSYDYQNSTIRLFTWNESGERISQIYKYKPSFYSETGLKADAHSIYGGKLKRHEFANDFDRRQYIKSGNMERIYGNLPVEQQFLVEKYWEVVKKPEFTQHPLSTFYVDIEVYSPDEFPDEWEAKHPINVITVYNSLKNEFKVFSLQRDFDVSKLSDDNKLRYKQISDTSDVRVTVHSTETALLTAFLNYWCVDHPDVVTGWHLPFDIPYIINRMIKKLGMKDVRRLSPLGKVREIERRIKIEAQRTESVRDYAITGVTVLDYKDVYVKFNMKPIPNKKLDTVLRIELKRGKVEYESSNLAKLSEDDWNLFVFYNIEDVNGIKLLEEKKKYLQIARMLANMGLVPLSKSLDTLPIVNGYCYVNALSDGKIIPTFEKKNVAWRKFDGAFVKEPTPGIYNNVVSFDLNSLYPMTMVTLNMSPETKFGKAIFKGNHTVIIEDNAGKETELSKENFYKLIKKYNLAISRANILFTQNKKGIFPKLIEEVYSKRVDDKDNIKKNKTKLQNGVSAEEEQRLIRENIFLDVSQYAQKIFLNSVYGYCGNKYSAMSDLDIAESVTLTCQDVIKESSDILNNIVYSIVGDKNIQEPTRYNDTDSVYITIDQILKRHNIPFLDDSNIEINPMIISICESIENKLNEKIKTWGGRELNTIDCRFHFKMEAISDRAFFIAKKNYILHILNDEGFHVENEYDRWKYKGIKLVSAGMPEDVKPLVKDIVHNIVMYNDVTSSNALYVTAYEKFKSLSCDDIPLIKSLNKFNDYVNLSNGWVVAPRMQAHYRGAYYYNIIISEMGLSAKYAKIKQSDKVKYLYLNPNNKYGINVISYIDNYPKEFESIFEVDRTLMFEKCVTDIVRQFYSAIKWNLISPTKQPKIDIMKEFLL